MANTSVWAKPDPDLAALRAQMASPEPAPTVWAPMDDSAPRALPAQPAPHVIWAPPHTAQDDAMNAQPVNMPDTGANLHAGLEKVFPPAQPQVALDPNPQHQIEGHLTNRLQQEYAKDAPWNPDDHGTMGKIGHVFSKIGGGLADTFLPGVVPGTSTYRHDTENNIAHELNSTIGEESQQAERGAQTENLGATTAKTQEETREAPAKAESEEGLQGAQTYRALHPLATSDFELWHQQNPNGTAQDFQNMQAKPLTPQDAESRNAIWDKIADQYHLPKGQFKAGMSSADAAQLAGSLNNVISRGQGAQSITIKQEGAGKAGDARSDKSFQYNQGELDKLTNPISQLTMRMGRMQDTINQGSPQADALVGPELLTVMAGGQGSGLRMNEAEIARVVGGRSNWESLKASINKWQLDPSKANSITPDQRQQIRALVKTVSDKLNSKQEILNQAAGDLVNSDDPKEHRGIVQKARLGLNSIDEGNQAAQGGGNAPQGATHTVPGSDGKMHYTDGKNDLGVVK